MSSRPQAIFASSSTAAAVKTTFLRIVILAYRF
jgi:hypothetical protein